MPLRSAEPTRRALLAAAIILPFAPLAAQPAPGGFAIDWQGGPQTPEIVGSLAAQVALVRALVIKPEIAEFFSGQTITVDLAADTHTRAGPRGVFFERRALPPGNPVLLHELLHRYHLLRLPDGRDNATVRDFFDRVRVSGKFPARAYMFTNPMEFFAMTASVVLHGHAARPPSTRANVASKAPDLYRWIAGEFGLRA